MNSQFDNLRAEPSLSELDRWLNSLDEQSVEHEIEGMEARVQFLEERVKQDRAETVDLMGRINRSRSALGIKRALAGEEAPNLGVLMGALLLGRRDPRQKVLPGMIDAPARGREAIRALMAEMPEIEEWTIPFVLSELAARGWADPDDDHAVQVSLSRMARSGELLRPRKGVYTLPPD